MLFIKKIQIYFTDIMYQECEKMKSTNPLAPTATSDNIGRSITQIPEDILPNLRVGQILTYKNITPKFESQRQRQ